jgi:hypothetical protein
VKAFGGSFVYDGTTHAGGSATVSGAGVIDANGATLSYSGDQVNAGSYTVTATYAGDANHEGSSDSATITISKADLYVGASNNSKIFGTTASDTGTVRGAVASDGITASFSSTGDDTAARVGTYSITATVNDPNHKLGNYCLHQTNATLTVNSGLAAGTQIHDKLFLLLANSDDIGTWFDVKVEMLDGNGNVIAVGTTPATKLGFVNNSTTNPLDFSLDVALTVINDVTMAAGSKFTFRVSSRIDPDHGGHSSGTAALQYDAAMRSSQVSVDFGNGLNTYYLHDSGSMNTNNNAGDTTVDVVKAANKLAGGDLYGSLGTWTGLVI